MVLHDLGARVIKVERPDSGDDARGFGPFVDGRSAYFTSLNCGKESIALDLDVAADRAVLERLCDRADVLVENFRPGTMDKHGFGWDALHVRHPRLIYAAVSGFGRTGPYSARPAYDMVVQGMGGVMSITGEDGGAPTRVGASIGDITAGLFLATGDQRGPVPPRRSPARGCSSTSACSTARSRSSRTRSPGTPRWARCRGRSARATRRSRRSPRCAPPTAR